MNWDTEIISSTPTQKTITLMVKGRGEKRYVSHDYCKTHEDYRPAA